MAYLLAHMFTEFGLIEKYMIDEATLQRFLQCVRSSYNNNPFHNFRHCFCVTQMVWNDNPAMDEKGITDAAP